MKQRRRRVARPSRRQRFGAFGIGPAPDYLARRTFTREELDIDEPRRWLDEYRRLMGELRRCPPVFDVAFDDRGPGTGGTVTIRGRHAPP